jgi:hypothetical protein
MNSSNSFLTYFLTILFALILLSFGFFSIFRSEKLMNSYINAIKEKNNYSNIHSKLLEKKIKNKWFYFNLRLVGIVIMVVALVMLFYTINVIIRSK